MRFINYLLVLQLISLPSVSLESTDDGKAMELPEQNLLANDSCEPDSISLLQGSLSQLNKGDQAHSPLKSVSLTHAVSRHKQAKRSHSLSGRDGSSGSEGAILLVCVLVIATVAVIAGLVYSHFGKKAESENQSYGKKAESDHRPLSPRFQSQVQQRPLGIICCGDGFAAMVRSDKDRAKLSQQAFESTLEDSVPFVIGTFTPDCMVEGHPNFSGRWKCVKVEGAIDSVLADLGLGYIERKAMNAWGCGAGKIVREYTHQGNHVKVHETGLADEAQEWDINGKEQIIYTSAPFCQTAYWDEQNPLVLVILGRDLQKQAPSTWTTTHQYFIDSRSFALQVRSSSGSACRWVYERIEKVSGDA